MRMKFCELGLSSPEKRCNNTMELKAKIRENTGSKASRADRAQDMIPVSFYGPGADALLLNVKRGEFEKVMREAGETTLIDLVVDGNEKANAKVLIYDTAFDPVSDNIIHADLYKAPLDKPIEVEVPLDFVGESIAVKDQHGTAIFTHRTLPVSCLPTAIPHSLKVDMSVIEDFDTHISVGDLKLPEGVTATIETDAVLVSVAPPRTQAQLDALDEEVDGDVSAVEGVEKEEGEEGEDGKSTDEAPADAGEAEEKKEE